MLCSDQNIGRLEIPMNHELRMGVSDRRKNLQEHLQALA